MAKDITLLTSDVGIGNRLAVESANAFRPVPMTRPSPAKLSGLVAELKEIEASGFFSNYGPVNARFERQVQSRIFEGTGACLTTCNATLGLAIALKHVTWNSAKTRRYVLMPSFTFAAAAHVVLWAGLTPLLCDIDEETWAPSTEAERRLLSRYGREIAAIMPYATFGNNIDLAHYERLSQEFGVPIVVDAAASLGSIDSDGRAFGTGFRHPIVFSMHATKAFATGEGGLIYSADGALVDALRAAGNFGFGAPRTATMPGLNTKLSEVAALLALAKLTEFDRVADHRDFLGKSYRANLPDWTFQRMLGRRQAHQFMPVLLPAAWGARRRDVIERLGAHGIGCGTYFSPHLAEQPYFRDRCRADDLGVTESVAGRVLSLPIHDGMTAEDVQHVCAALKEAVESPARVAAAQRRIRETAAPSAREAAPLVSIVVTSYNHREFIGEAIESALGQTYPNTEVIVVDDGSTDGSQTVIERFHGRCRIVFRSNGGQAAASLSGFNASSGDIVLFLDSDDRLDSDAVAHLVDHWRDGCSKAQFYLRIVDARGRPHGGSLPNIPLEADEPNRQYLMQYGYYPSPPTSGNAYARGFLAEVLPEAASTWRFGLDGYLIGLAPLYGSTVSIDRELGSYRIHGRNGYHFSGMDLTKLRSGMMLEIRRERAIVEHAGRAGVPIPRPLILNIPAHCKARILSLRLDAETHPVPDDRILPLLVCGIRSIWCFPHMRSAKRVVSTLGLLAIVVLPRRWLAPRLQFLFVAEARRGWAEARTALGRVTNSASAWLPFLLPG